MADTKTSGSKASSANKDRSPLDEAADRGYLGQVPDEKPDNAEYSLQSGPESPTAHEVYQRLGRAPE